jgi:hypothetical protein
MYVRYFTGGAGNGLAARDLNTCTTVKKRKTQREEDDQNETPQYKLSYAETLRLQTRRTETRKRGD